MIPKFRAWDKVEKSMCRVVAIDFRTAGMVTLYNEGAGDKSKVGRFSYSQRWENIDILQVTGLLDREGKEIWEGDILMTQLNVGSIARPRAVVVFTDDGFYAEHPAWRLRLKLLTSITVIGNKWQNPELMEVGK